ncbi:hypothetical protein F2Q69_00059645 [Brassica cretica]|uniref:Retrotransposon gag domain-containing protein n=1 Tax=Brassica cretica TaxID=69181 RepID=A0A8S9RBV1_BRACR|nr:hypothetical protein F2Q69_00059645 [Brassica cretica]
MIHKSKRAVDTLQAAINNVKIRLSNDIDHLVSIDTLQAAAIDSVNQKSTDGTTSTSTDGTTSTSTDGTASTSTDGTTSTSTDGMSSTSTDGMTSTSINGTVHLGTVHLDTFHPAKTDITCEKAEKVEVLILKVDENDMLRDEEGHTRNSACQLINAQGAVIPNVIAVAEMNDFDLSREWYNWVSQDPFQGLLREDPRNHIEELEDLASRSEQNEIFVDHILCMIFPYSLSGDAFRWFKQLQQGSLTCWEDITSAFFNKFIYKPASNLEIEMRSMMEYMITMEDFLELEDEAQPENLDQNLEKKLDDVQHTSEKDLETSPKVSIDQHQPDEINRHHPASSITTHQIASSDTHPRSSIDTHRWTSYHDT